jgi:hypothetical protein
LDVSDMDMVCRFTETSRAWLTRQDTSSRY